MLPPNPHLAMPVSHAGAPLDRARAVVVMLHGRSQDPAHIEGHIAQRIGLDGIAYVAPAAADGTWYPASFMAPAVENEPRLSFALDRVATLTRELDERGVDRASLVLMGFSQGACLASEFVYRRRFRCAAFFAFTGGLVGPEGTRWPSDASSLEGMPAFFGGSTNDAWVPIGRMLESAAVFTELGARVVTQFYEEPSHHVSDVEIEYARAALRALGAS
jgi:phospholipase/carboxylesterase